MPSTSAGTPISHRSVISYIDRTREFYAAAGYERPYRWAHYADVPFTPLAKPLSECRVGLVTTTSPSSGFEPDPGALRGDKSVWSGATDPPPERLHTDHLSWDKETTHTDDVESFLPIRALQRLAEKGRIGGLSPRFYGAPTDYSQRRNVEDDAPEVLRLCREDGVDVARLVPL
jgi:hypothetical protein